MDEIATRFLDALDILVKEGKEKSVRQIALKIGIKPSQISEAKKGERGIPDNHIKNLESFYDVNKDFIFSGRGNFYISEHNVKTKSKPSGIPMYDSAATASGVEVYNDLVQDEPAFVVNIPQFRDCSFGKVIYGHSMYPTIESGTYVFCKPVSNKLHIIPGEIYYIEYDNYGVVKRLQKGDSPENVLAVSDNDEVRKDGSRRYESYTIPFDSIRNIYLIKGHFKQSHN
jgi:phage repressor protein C with HTH and peptisase S24 domain